MKQKRIVLQILVYLQLLMMIVLAGCSAPRQQKPIIIGHVTDLSGPRIEKGRSEKLALEMEIERINSDGGFMGRRVELISQDSKGDPTEAVRVVRELVDKGVAGIIGPAQSNQAVAVSTITEPAGIPFIATTADHPAVTIDSINNRRRNTAFRVSIVDYYLGEAAGSFALGFLQTRRGAVLFDGGSDYSLRLTDAFVKAFTLAGGSIISLKNVREIGEGELNSFLQEFKMEGGEVLFLPLEEKIIPTLIKEIQGRELTLLGIEEWQGIAADTSGPVYILKRASLKDPLLQDWVKEYQETYGIAPVLPGAALAVDALLALLQAEKGSWGVENSSLRDQLEKTSDLSVLTGNLTIEPETHNPQKKEIAIEVYRDGTSQFLTRFRCP